MCAHVAAPVITPEVACRAGGGGSESSVCSPLNAASLEGDASLHVSQTNVCRCAQLPSLAGCC